MLILTHGDLYAVRRLRDGRSGWSFHKFPDIAEPSRDVWVDESGELHCDCAAGTMKPEIVCRHIKAVVASELLP